MKRLLSLMLVGLLVAHPAWATPVVAIGAKNKPALVTAKELTSAGTVQSRNEAGAAPNNPVQVTAKEVTQAVTVQSREEAVAAKEQALAQKEQELAAMQAEIDTKLVRYAKLQQEVASQLTELQGVQSKRFKNLIAVYSAMSPSKVAPLLNSMEDNTVAQVLQAMKTDLVAKIVPKLEPDKAVRVSKRLGLIK